MAEAAERVTRGRPREFDGPPVRVRLPASLHDELCVEAIRRDTSVSAVIRERLVVRKSTTGKTSAQ
jgi:hypothetical protein